MIKSITLLSLGRSWHHTLPPPQSRRISVPMSQRATLVNSLYPVVMHVGTPLCYNLIRRRTKGRSNLHISWCQCSLSSSIRCLRPLIVDCSLGKSPIGWTDVIGSPRIELYVVNCSSRTTCVGDLTFDADASADECSGGLGLEMGCEPGSFLTDEVENISDAMNVSVI
jgi:hypothetical protein